jgi:hypothetical protein
MKKSLLGFVKISALAGLALLAVSCQSTHLYSWYNYQSDYYHYLKNGDEDSLDKLIKTYEKIIAKQTAERKIVPPGIYADYGYALLEKGKAKEAKAMFAKEIELYPESEPFISAILKRFEK